MFIPRLSALLTLVAFALGIALFFFLNSSFGGPTPLSGVFTDEPYELEMSFDEAEGLLTKSLVLVRGVEVGEVRRVALVGDHAEVTISVEERYAPLPRGTTAQLRNRTVFGEKYVSLRPPADLPPPAAEEDALPSGAQVVSERVVGLDDALEFLNDERRKKLTATLDEFAVATRPPETADRLNETLAALSAFTGSARDLTDELRGQAPVVAGLVDGGRAAVTTLGDREQALRRITGSARTTLEAIGGQSDAVDATLSQLPPTLAVTRSAIGGTRALAIDARPLVRNLRRAIPDLEASVEDLGPVTADAIDIVDRLPALRRAGDPVLRRAVPALRALEPVAKGLEPALANTVPVTRFAGRRKNELSSSFANTAATTSGDAEGAWTRFFVIFEPNLAAGEAPAERCEGESEPAAAGFCSNAYPHAGDAADNAPFDGRYQRLMPFEPPPSE